MKKIAKLVSILIFSAVAALVISAGVVAKSSSFVSEPDSKSEATRKLYLNNCARCHGADGKSMTNLGQELDAPDITTSSVKGMSSAKMSRIISKGDGSMPAFGKKLTRAQIISIVRYVKSL